MTKAKKQLVEKVLEQGTVIFEKSHPYWNPFIGKQCVEYLRHVQYNGQVWDVTFINNKLYDAFIISAYEVK